jgi:glycerophosphoryl diester phosphodiesterase
MTTRKLLVAHRGVRTNGHANTLDAFDRAIRLGADMLEFDVRRTGDGVIVVHHDEDIGGRRLASMDFAAAQREAAARGYRLPAFEELLALAAGRVRLDVELKEGAYEAAVLDLIAAFHVPIDDFVVTAFDAGTLTRVRQAGGGVRTGLLLDADQRQGAFERFAASGADFLAAHYTLLDDDAVLGPASAGGVDILAWTVNDPEWLARLLGHPAITGVITDALADSLRIRDAGAGDSSRPL